jgi:hypothetical protein
MDRLARLLGITFVLTLCFQPRAQAQHDLGGWFSPSFAQLDTRASYQGTILPSQRVEGQPTFLGFSRHDVNLAVPCYQDEANEWAATGNVRAEFFQTHAILPNTFQPFPDDLYNIRFGTTYRHLFDNDWVGGASVSVGSASDQPFSTVNELVANISAYLRVPSGERNAWLFSLNYSTISEFLPGVPIPGVAFFYNPNEWFQATIGFPFASITWRPMEDFTVTASYAPITNMHLKATYRLMPALSIYGGFDWEYESYFLADRLDDREKFWYADQRASVGVQYKATESIKIDLSTGYEFNRFYFEGRNYSDNHFNRVDVGSGPFAAFRVALQF